MISEGMPSESPFLEEQQQAASSFRSTGSMISIVRERTTCRRVLFTIFVWFFFQLGVTVSFLVIFTLQQLLLLPCRPCRGRPLAFMQRLTAPILACLAYTFVTTNTCESCYGANVNELQSFDAFLQKSCSASRRKNIKRNLKAADEEMRRQGIEVSNHSAGTWRISRELRNVIWDQCRRHEARAFGYSDILNCSQPTPSLIMYVGELVLMLAFPSDIQLFRSSDGTLISLNTTVHIGNTLWNPNYATTEQFSRCGIYPWTSRYQLKEAIRLRCEMLNVMPSMRSAKGRLGLRELPRGRLLRASWAGGLCCCSRREPRPATVEEPIELPPADIADEAPRVPKGRKRAARKRVAAEAAAKAATEEPTQLPPAAIADEAPSVPKGGKRAARKRAAAEAAANTGTEEPMQLPQATIADKAPPRPQRWKACSSQEGSTRGSDRGRVGGDHRRQGSQRLLGESVTSFACGKDAYTCQLHVQESTLQ